MISTFDTDRNFWATHPDMKVITPFKQIYEDDKSKKKELSSVMMWFVILCYDRDTKLFKQPIEDRHKIIGEDFAGDILYYSKNKLLIDTLIIGYVHLQYTPMQILMASWDKKLQQRAKWIDGLAYEEDDEKLDKAMERTLKVYASYKLITEDMLKEENSGAAKGGAMESLLD